MVLTKTLTFIYSYPQIRIFVSMCFLENISLVQKTKNKKRLHLDFCFLKLTHFAWFSIKVLEAYERYTNINLHPGAHLAYICTVLINLECKSICLNGL